MSAPDPLLTAYADAQALLQAARPDQIHEALRLLSFQVAYCERYHEVLPAADLAERIGNASHDPAAAALVTEGLGHLADVLRRLNVAPAGPATT